MKAVAYEIAWDICWEPGLPDKKSPDYYRAEENSCRRHCREVGIQYDADIIDSTFPNHREFTSHLWNAPEMEINQQDITSAKFNMDKSICFIASLDLLGYLDFPYNNVRWPIMSQQMVKTLKKVCEFRHHIYSTVMEDNTVHRAGDEIKLSHWYPIPKEHLKNIIDV
jgi:hypothetical protein